MSYGERGESQFAWKEPGATLEKEQAGRKDEAERAAKLLGAEIEFFDCGDYPLKLRMKAISIAWSTFIASSTRLLC